MDTRTTMITFCPDCEMETLTFPSEEEFEEIIRKGKWLCDHCCKKQDLIYVRYEEQ